MSTSDPYQSLTQVRKTTSERADEVSLFFNPITGDHRLVVRGVCRRDGVPCQRSDKRVVPSVTAAQVADAFGVSGEAAKALLRLARQEMLEG